jgi:hypothetical protein
MVAELSVGCQLLTPSGWLEVEDEPNGYSVHADTINTRAVTHRTKDAKGDWVEGGFAFSAVRENITETLAIWVFGYGSVFAFRQRMEVLEDTFNQLWWQVALTVADAKETWTVAEPADYTITTSGPFFVATTGFITAQVPRLPALLLEEVV